jgi:hypothetical protein
MAAVLSSLRHFQPRELEGYNELARRICDVQKFVTQCQHRWDRCKGLVEESLYRLDLLSRTVESSISEGFIGSCMRGPTSQKELMHECATAQTLSCEAGLLLMRVYQQANHLPSGSGDFLSDMKKRQSLAINGARRFLRDLESVGPWGRSYDYLKQIQDLVEAIH